MTHPGIAVAMRRRAAAGAVASFVMLDVAVAPSTFAQPVVQSVTDGCAECHLYLENPPPLPDALPPRGRDGSSGQFVFGRALVIRAGVRNGTAPAEVTYADPMP